MEWKAKKPGEICQYLDSNPVPYDCKLIWAGLVLIDGL